MESDMGSENTDQARYERHLAEIEERMERFHRETSAQTEQLFKVFHQAMTEVKRDMARRQQAEDSHTRRIVQLLSYEGYLIALYGDGQYRHTPLPALHHPPSFPEGIAHG